MPAASWPPARRRPCHDRHHRCPPCHRTASAGPRRLCRHLRGHEAIHAGAHAGHARCAMDLRACPGLHPRRGGQAGPHPEPRRHPGRADRPRRPGHLPRPRPSGGVPVDRPAPGGLFREGIRLPHRGIGAAHAGPFRRDRPPRAQCAGHLRAPGRPVLPCGADRPAARRRPLPRPGQDRRAGHQGEPTRDLPRRGAERRHGPRTLLAHQPLRLRGAANGRPFYNRHPNHMGRSCPGPEPKTHHLPGARAIQ